jgi:HSP20 family molecular chaperone IbpA
MFNKKKKCEKCGKRIGEKYNFCPYCGKDAIKEGNEDFGMLGKNDFFPAENQIKLPLGFNTLFNSLMKNLSREFDEEIKKGFAEENSKKANKEGISISISTFGNGVPKIKVSQMGNKPKQEKETEKQKKDTFTKEKIKKFSELKREEPKTNLRRLSNKLIYELELPGVNSIDDISIVKLENSIEIKAIGEKKSYAKIIPINLPITNYDLSKEKLILELGIKN